MRLVENFGCSQSCGKSAWKPFGKDERELCNV